MEDVSERKAEAGHESNVDRGLGVGVGGGGWGEGNETE